MGRAVRFVATARQKDRLAEVSGELCVIIPTAGASQRQQVAGPQALYHQQNDSLLRRQIAVIKKVYPQADIVVVTGFSADTVMNSLTGVRFVENERYAETNVLRSIALGMRASVAERALIFYGDILCSVEALSHGHNDSWVVGTKRLKPGAVGLIVTNGMAANFAYDLDLKWGKIAHLCGKELKLFKKVAFDPMNRKLLGHEALNQIIDEGAEIKCHMIAKPNKQLWEVESSRDLQ